MDEKKTPQPEQAAPETGKPLSEKRKSALLRYMAVLFCAAFILVLISQHKRAFECRGAAERKPRPAGR